VTLPFSSLPPLPGPAEHAPHRPAIVPPSPHIFTAVYYAMATLLSSNVVNYLGTAPPTASAHAPRALADPPCSLAIPAGGRLRQRRTAVVPLLAARPRDGALCEECRPAHAHPHPPGRHVLRPAAGRGYQCVCATGTDGAQADQRRRSRDTTSAATTGSPTRCAMARC
jgi:hypothetical protein